MITFVTLSSLMLLAATSVASMVQPQNLSTTKPVVRETTAVEIGGVAEEWRLGWESDPKWTCGPDDPESNTCPCSGFAYGESGTLDLIRSRKGHNIEMFHLTPLFGDDAPAKGRATLQYWPFSEQEFNEIGTSPLIARTVGHPAVKIMRLADYNHDGNASEFYLQTGTEPCGKHAGVVIGVTASNPRLHAFGSATHPDTPLVLQEREWNALLKSSGPVEVTDWACGDHGSDEETDITLAAKDGVIQAQRREYECDENGKRGKLVREDDL